MPEATDSGAGSGPVTFRPASLAEAIDGGVTDGEGVTMEVALISATVVHTSETRSGVADAGGVDRYLVLALPLGAPYLKELEAVREELTKLGAELAAVKPGKPPAELSAFLERHDALAKRFEASKVVPSEGLVVELEGFDVGRMRVSWEKVIRECTGTFCMPVIPTIPPIDISPLDKCAFVGGPKVAAECLTMADERLGKLAAFDPPARDEALPKLPSMLGIDERDLVTRYNKLVPRFNKEVERRQAAAWAALPGRVDRLSRITAASSQRWALRGIKRPLSSLAARLYRETLGSAPAHQIEETPAPGSPSFSSATYAKTRYCFTSQPPGADIVVGGSVAGRAPACVNGLRTGEETEILLTLPGRAPAKVEPAMVRASPANLTELDCVLAKNGSAGTSGCRLAF